MSDFNPNPHPPAGATHSDGTPIAGTPAPPANSGVEQFDRAYVEDLRGQAADYRTKYAPFRDAFDGYTEEERQEWLSLVADFSRDPVATAQRMREIAEAVAPSPFEPITQTPIPEPTPTPEEQDRPLTVREFQAMQAEAQRQAQAEAQAQQQESSVRGIYQEAEQLGYKPGTKEIVDLFWIARNQTGGDLKAAHAQMIQQEQQVVARYLESKGYDTTNTPIPVSRGVAPSGETEIKDFGSAKESLLRRLEAL